MKHPVSTISNLAYFVSGILLLDRSPIIAFSMIGLSIGSTAYHATGTRWGARLDEIGMYAALSAILAHLLASLSLDLAGTPIDVRVIFASLLAPLAAFSGRLDSYSLRFPFGVLPWLGLSAALGIAWNLAQTYPATIAALSAGGLVLLFALAFALRQFAEYLASDRLEDILHGTTWHPLTAYGLHLAAILSLL